jgi:SAM-dependent methyltransferase
MNIDEYAKMYQMEDEHWWFVARRNLIARALTRFLPAGAPSSETNRLLDVGCGTGGTLDRLSPFGNVVGLDLETTALAFCRERGYGRLVQASATAMPFAEATFDAIVALDVLEHIPDHEAAAREIMRVLKPGGAVFVTVPAYRSLWSGHDVALMHQRRYIAREVETLLVQAGLSIEHLTYTVSALFPVAYLVRTAQRRLHPSAPPRADVRPTAPLLNLTLLGLLDMESRVALVSQIPYGLSIFAVARKPLR